jgi:hypothetical protein
VILYSIIPNEIVFANSDESYENKYMEIDYAGEKVQVLALTNSQYVINRIISTSPRAYLDPRLQPGTIIKGAF